MPAEREGVMGQATAQAPDDDGEPATDSEPAADPAEEGGRDIVEQASSFLA